jgi:azurin
MTFHPPTPRRRRLAALVSAAALALGAAGVARAQDAPAADAPAAEAGAAPKIDVTKSAAIQKYQLKRLTTAQLVLVERKAEKPYKTVYEALLTRKGIDRKIRQEAADGLAKINGTDPAVELINGLGLVNPDEDKATPKELVGLLMAQKPAALAAQKEKLQSLAAEAEKPVVKQAAYAAWAVADGNPDAAWKAAEGKGDLKALVGGVPLIADAKVRGAFYDKVAPLAAKAADEPTQVAAIDALSYIPGHEADAFKTLSGLIGTAGATGDAAVRSLGRVPAAKLPKDELEPVAKKVVDVLKAIPVDKRTDDPAINAVQLAKDLAAALPPAQGNPIRKAVRSLAVETVKIRTYREQMLYDTRYFVVEAGKPVQVVLENDDAMAHNIVFTVPGAFQKVAEAGAPLVNPPEGGKPFVPATKDVLFASDLAQGDDTIKMSFTAPKKPGEYDFVCTFPGHFVRMYGVMVVVEDVEKYERNPKAPTDPLTRKPMESRKQEPMGGAPAAHAEHGH